MPKVVAVTGFAGFIGRRVTTKLLERGDYVYGVDALTYAADPAFAGAMESQFDDHFHWVAADIRTLGRWPDIDAIIHLAAETHVDNSITETASFIATNVEGTRHLLDMTVAKRQHAMPRFIYVSTDEVYGPIKEGAADTGRSLRPSSPYAASKAAADLLVQAYGVTYQLPYTIVRPTNCYGVGQYPEKLIPKTIRSLSLGRRVPIHGDGTAERCWLAVEDCASAIVFALEHARTLPPILNIGGNTAATVGDVVARIADHLRDVMPTWLREYAEYGYERPGMDERYAVDDRVLREAGWCSTGDLWADLPGLVETERRTFRW